MRPRTLADFQGECRPSGEQLNFRLCPVCGSDSWKLYVHPENGKWYCHAGEHSGGGKVEIGGQENVHDEGSEILRLLTGNNGVEPLTEIDLPPFEELSKTARRYLSRRGLDDQAIAKYGIVEWSGEYRVLIPYFDSQGRLVYWNSRRYSERVGDGPKYKAAPGRHPLYVPSRKPLAETSVIVEGAFDAIAVDRATGYRAIALGGKSLPQYLVADLRKATNLTILLVLLDSDALAAAITLQTKVGGRIVLVPKGQDPADLEPNILKEMLL